MEQKLTLYEMYEVVLRCSRVTVNLEGSVCF